MNIFLPLFRESHFVRANFISTGKTDNLFSGYKLVSHMVRFAAFRRPVHSFHRVCRTLLEKLSIPVEIQSRAAECSE
jgi:hypothetical protein